jgi:hypothetical protein
MPSLVCLVACLVLAMNTFGDERQLCAARLDVEENAGDRLSLAKVHELRDSILCVLTLRVHLQDLTSSAVRTCLSLLVTIRDPWAR